VNDFPKLWWKRESRNLKRNPTGLIMFLSTKVGAGQQRQMESHYAWGGRLISSPFLRVRKQYLMASIPGGKPSLCRY
jgi:hypothetical protein